MPHSTQEEVHCGRCGRKLKHHRTHSIFGKLGFTCYSKVAGVEEILTNFGMTTNHNNETLYPAEKDENGNWGPPKAVTQFLNQPRKEALTFTHEIIPNPDNQAGAPLVKINVQFDRTKKRAPKIKTSAQVDAERTARMLRNRERTLSNMRTQSN